VIYLQIFFYTIYYFYDVSLLITNSSSGVHRYQLHICETMEYIWIIMTLFFYACFALYSQLLWQFEKNFDNLNFITIKMNYVQICDVAQK